MKSLLPFVLCTSLLASDGWAADAQPVQPFNPGLVSYRLEAKALNFSVLEEYQGQKIVVHVDLTNKTDQSSSPSLRLNSERLEPFFPYIPPYVGLGARKFTAKVWIGSTKGVWELRLILDRMGNDYKTIPIDLPTAKPNQWNDVELDDPNLGSTSQPLTGVRLECKLDPGTQADIYLADTIITTDTGFTYNLLNKDMPLMLTGMSKPLAAGPAHPLPERDSVTFGGYAIEDEGWNADLPAMTKFMNEHFPDADFVIAPVWTPHPVMADRVAKLPAGVFFQFQKAQLDTGYLGAMNALAINSAGKPLPGFGNGILGTHPLVQAALKDQIDYAASLGINNFKQVDYVWPYDQGLWGYDPASVAAAQEDVTEKDEGLDLLPGPGGQPAGVIHFWDYFEAYHGMRLKPDEVGIDDWAKYDPALEKTTKDPLELKKLGGVHLAIIHYEWLRMAQRFGRWAKSVGGKHDYTLNGEDWLNGGDYIYLTRLVDGGTPYFEYFGSPGNMQWNYLDCGKYVHAGELAKKRLGLITEIGEGGHGENYLASEVGYLYAYEVAAMGIHDYHNEWAESSFSFMSDPKKNAYLYDRFSSWVGQAFGFRRAWRDGVTRPDSNVLSLELSSSVYGHINGDETFAQMLSDDHVNFQQTDLMSSPDSMDKADVIFYGADCSPDRMSKQIGDWLAKGGRTLVTHSFIPLALDYGQTEPTQDTARNTAGFPSFHLLPEFKGLAIGPSGRWMLDGTHLLLGTHDKPLLSEMTLSGDSHIFYIHDELKNLTKQETADVTNKLNELIHLPQIVVEKPELGGSVMAELFQHGQTEVLSLWNRDRLNQHGFGGGYGPHLLPGRGGDVWSPKVRPYPYPEPGAKCGAAVPVVAAGTYRIYRFFADKEETVTVGDDKMLPLTVEGTAMEQFYFAPDGNAIQQEIAGLHKFRAEVAPFFTDIPAATK